MNDYLQEVYSELGFGNKRKIYITPKLNYDIIIKTNKLSPKIATQYIIKNLDLIKNI